MLSLLGKLPIEWQIGLLTGAVLAVFGSLGGAYLYIDHQGYDRGYQKASLEGQVKYDRRELELAQQRADERDRQDSINAMKKAEEARDLEEQRKQKDTRNRLALQLADEAAKDPSAGVIALDQAAIDRYNRRIVP